MRTEHTEDVSEEPVSGRKSTRLEGEGFKRNILKNGIQRENTTKVMQTMQKLFTNLLDAPLGSRFFSQICQKFRFP